MTDHILYDPTGNITAFVTEPVSPGDRAAIAKEILDSEPRAEQVGFLSGCENADIRLDMACGEFCGNATMSAALHRYLADGSEGEREMTVSVSGADVPVRTVIRPAPVGYEGTVKMPGPFHMTRLTFDIDGKTAVLPAVLMPGITHIIIQDPEGKQPLTPEQAERLLPSMAAETGAECLGVMFYEPSSAVLRPLVYSADIDALYWEGSCASGTSALGYFLAATGALAPWDDLVVSQPGGRLRVSSPKPGEVYITGSVNVLE